MREANGGYEQVVWTDALPKGFEPVPEVSIAIRRGIVKRQRDVMRERLQDEGDATIKLAVFARAVEQFGADNGARDDLCRGMEREPMPDGALGILEVVNLRVGIEQPGHHQLTRFSKSP